MISFLFETFFLGILSFDLARKIVMERRKLRYGTDVLPYIFPGPRFFFFFSSSSLGVWGCGRVRFK